MLRNKQCRKGVITHMRRQTSIIKPQMLLIQAVGLLALGLAILIRPEWAGAFVQTLLVAALLINAVLTTVTLVTDHFAGADVDEAAADATLVERVRHGCASFMEFMRSRQPRPRIINAALSVLLGALIALFPQIIAGGFGIGFGLWALLTGGVQLAFATQLRSTGSRGFTHFLVRALISLLFGLALIINPISRLVDVKLIAGVYMLLFSLSAFIDFLDAMFKWDLANSRLLARVRVLPPVMLTSMLPVWLLDKFNRMLERNNTDYIYEKPDSAPAKPEEMSNVPLEILFHLGRNVALGYGHVDIALGNTVYSYGCYDDASSRWMGFYSDGTFMVAGLQPYLDYCRRWQRKTLVSFTMRLTVEQEMRVRIALDNILGNCTPWRPTECNSTAIGQSAHASSVFPIRYYKVASGPFKIYSVFRTNCVAMAEILVGESGLKVLPTHGIITPGSYYAFLERQLKNPDSPVVRKTVYKIKGRATEAGMTR